MHTTGNRQHGVTLLELLIVLVIVAVLAMIAGPSFRDTIERNRRLSSLEQTISLLTLARAEAVSRSARVHVCPSTDSATCTDGSNLWSVGLLVFVDNGGPAGAGTAGDGILQAGDGEEIVRILSRYENGITLYGPPDSLPLDSAIIFDANGSAIQSGAIQACDENGVDTASAIIVGVSGQLRLAVDQNANGIVNLTASDDVTCS